MADKPLKSLTFPGLPDRYTIPSSYSDVGAASASHTHSYSDVGAASAAHTHTYTQVGAASAAHVHGSITSDGKITATGITLANGDALVVTDSSASHVIKKTSITFDGSTTTKALTQKGTFETFLQSYTETDPTVPSWAKASTKPTYTYSEVGASSAAHTHTYSDVGASSAAHTHTYSQVGAASAAHTHTAADVGAVPTSRTVNGKSLNANITLSAADVGAATSTHAHGSITNGGAITDTGITLANGDALVVTDSSASHAVKKTSITFDGSTTTKALTQKGTFETFLQSYTETDPTVPSWAKATNKPSYTYSEVGASSAAHTHTYSDVGAASAAHTHTFYWADVQTTTAATYNKAPELAILKLNGNTSATAASTSNV